MKPAVWMIAALMLSGQAVMASAQETPFHEKGEQDEAIVYLKKFKRMVPAEQEKVRADGLKVYAVCSACHLPEGWGTKDGTYPQIAGQWDTVIIKQLADIRAKNRDNPTMYPYSVPEEIERTAPGVGGGAYALAAVARYISQIPMNPEPGMGQGVDLEHAANLYATNCAQCHGTNGQGSEEKHIPLIQGQSYNYLVRQLTWIRDGKRRNADPDMSAIIAGFSDTDMEIVSDYVSRMKPPVEKLAPSADWWNPDFD